MAPSTDDLLLSQPRTMHPLRGLVPRDWPHTRQCSPSDAFRNEVDQVSDRARAREEAFLRLREQYSASLSDLATTSHPVKRLQLLSRHLHHAGKAHRWTVEETFSPGANGIVFRARAKDVPVPVVFKTVEPHMAEGSRTYAYLKKTITHEAFIGMAVTNTLRATIPHFVYVYGGFTADACLTTPEGEVLQVMADPKTRARYVLCEDLSARCTTLNDALVDGTLSVGDILCCWTQVALALAVAGDKADYCHNDCHPGNVMWGPLCDNEVLITYPLAQRGPVHVVTRQVATLIDLAGSTALTHHHDTGERYRACGMYVPLELGVSPSRSNRGYDLFSLVMSTMHILFENQQERKANKLMPFVSLFFEGETKEDRYDRARLFATAEAMSQGLSVLPPDRDMDPLAFVKELNTVFCPSWLKLGVGRAPSGRCVRPWNE